ncbi:CLUMA_CG012022, isoform A, partial [Clunio marinus]
KNHYIKYTRGELESYCNDPETCIKKVHSIEPITFSPIMIADFRSTINKLLSSRIGKYDAKLEGVVLDFRNTKILQATSAIRQDSAFSVINIETCFYIFSPRKGAIVTGTVKYINRMSMETIVSVIIYRVFNVKVTVKGRIKQEIDINQEIKIRVKDFHFDNVIPFIEGEVFKSEIVQLSQRKIFDDAIDSGISDGMGESSSQIEVSKELYEMEPAQLIRVKHLNELNDEVGNSSQKEVKKSRKRRISKDFNDSTTISPIKKIKTEPVTDDNNVDTIIKQEFDSEQTLSQILNESHNATESFINGLENNIMQTESSSKKKKKKDKKEKRRNREDDFETSIQMLLSSAPFTKE